ncbi:MAG: hypothetical protein ACRD21_05955 [Vicinamibacteria bacterium]
MQGDQFREALKWDPFDAECYGLGEIYEGEGTTTRAHKMFEQVKTYDPENDAVQTKLGLKRESRAVR